MRPRHVEVTGGFAALLAVLLCLDRSGVLPWVMLGCVLHELGHCLAIHLLGGQIALFRLSLGGAELRLSAARPLGQGKTLLAVLAGPAVNMAAAVVSAALARRGLGETLFLFAGVSLALAAFNLLPTSCLDGGKALRCLLFCLGAEGAADRAVLWSSTLSAALVLLLGIGLLYQSGGWDHSLLLCGAWLLFTGLREQGR